MFAADARYAIGTFDGRTFTPEHEGKHQVHHGDYYASQIFSNAPDGRRIQIGWARIAMPGMPFNQTFSFPHELTLRSTADGIRMFAEPAKEIRSLYKETHSIRNQELTEAQRRLFRYPANYSILKRRSMSVPRTRSDWTSAVNASPTT